MHTSVAYTHVQSLLRVYIRVCVYVVVTENTQVTNIIAKRVSVWRLILKPKQSDRNNTIIIVIFVFANPMDYLANKVCVLVVTLTFPCLY